MILTRHIKGTFVSDIGGETTQKKKEEKKKDWYIYQNLEDILLFVLQTNLIKINERKDFNLCC